MRVFWYEHCETLRLGFHMQRCGMRMKIRIDEFLYETTMNGVQLMHGCFVAHEAACLSSALRHTGR